MSDIYGARRELVPSTISWFYNVKRPKNAYFSDERLEKAHKIVRFLQIVWPVWIMRVILVVLIAPIVLVVRVIRIVLPVPSVTIVPSVPSVTIIPVVCVMPPVFHTPVVGLVRPIP